jgi:hypothetical protein
MAINEATAVGNVLLGYKFRMEFNDYPPALVQDCNIPEREYEEVMFGGAGQDLNVKEAGGEKINEFKIMVVCPAKGAARLFWDQWMNDVGTHDCLLYWRDVTLIQMGPNDEPNMTWDIQDCWPKKRMVRELKTEAKNEIVKWEITMACNDCKPRLPTS